MAPGMETITMDPLGYSVQALSDMKFAAVPATFVRSAAEQKTIIAHNEYSEQIPVIDLGGLNDDARRESTMAEIAAAGEDWGFFQVLNHGVPLPLVEHAYKLAREFFDLPQEEKETVAMDPTKTFSPGYGRQFHSSENSTQDWNDVLFHYFLPPSLKNIDSWPNKPAAYSQLAEADGSQWPGMMAAGLPHADDMIGEYILIGYNHSDWGRLFEFNVSSTRERQHIDAYGSPLPYIVDFVIYVRRRGFPYNHKLPLGVKILSIFINRIGGTLHCHRETMEKYGDEILKFTDRMLEIFCELLGLKPTYIKDVIGEPMLNIRLNFYPSCPEPNLVLGLRAHSDPNVLTVLFQDETGGLQVKKGDKWIGVAPVPGALVVNLADQMQVVSNDRFQSVEHRVVTNQASARMSVTTFLHPSMDIVLGPAPELVDEQHPALYKTLDYAAYRTAFHTKARNGKILSKDNRAR